MTLFRSASHWGAFNVRVEDGRIEDITPFAHDPSPNALIASWKEMVYAPTRVARPAVRKGWLDGDGGEGRGRDTYVEVDWDRALDLVAANLRRTIDRHGNSAIFGGSYGWASAGRLHHARTLLHRFLNGIGGFTGQVTNYSYGAAMGFLPTVIGSHDAVSSNSTELRTVAEEGDVLIALGGIPAKNWEVLSGGFGIHGFRGQMEALARSRVRVFNVSPYRGDCAPELGAEWVAIRANTDAALLLACIRQLIADGTHDQAFLDRYTHGFDRLAAYLGGEGDGVVKDAAWAAGITGLDEGFIRDFARGLVGRRVMVSAAWSLQRARNGEMVYWAAIALAAALGQVGLPGGGFAFGYGSMNGAGGPRYATPLSGPGIGSNPVGVFIPVARVTDLILNPGKTIRFSGHDITYPGIRLIYWAGGNVFHHHQDLRQLQRAFRSVDCVVVHEQFWTATARHADIVLPATTAVERNDIGGSSRDPFIVAMEKAIEPVGEARNDFDIFADLSRRLLGGDEAFTEGRDEMGWLAHMWQRTATTLRGRGLDAPDFDEFWREGSYRLPTPDRRYVYMERFRQDPEASPLATRSGRIELFSQAIAEQELEGQPGHACWLDPEEWAGAAVARTYPLHMLTPQPSRKLHSQFEGSSLTRSAKRQGRECLRINPQDAAARGIADGDAVRLFNERGACIGVASLTDGLRQGVVLLPTGATYDPDEDGNDRNSNPNVLTRDIGTSELGQGCAAQSCMIEIERLDGPLPPLTTDEPPLG